MDNEKKAMLALRIGLAFSFIYAGISIFADPGAWIGFVPSFVQNIGGEFSLYAHAGLDIILGLWLLTNRGMLYASILGALNLLVISLFNISQMDIIFRDISLVLMAVALAFLSIRK